MIVATDPTGRTRRFRTPERFVAWYLAAPRGHVRVVDISVADPGPGHEPAPHANGGPVGHPRH